MSTVVVTQPGAMRVALDVTPLLGAPTGVGTFCAGALEGLAARADLAVRGFAVTWRRRGEIADQLPEGIAAVRRPMPARPLHWAWRRSPLPPVEWLVGRMDVVHATNFVAPPARRAAVVVTVHDLTALRFPEMCEPVSWGFPDQIRRALSQGAWVHTPSEWVAAEVVEMLGADPARVRAVHHGAPSGPTPGSPAPRDPGHTAPGRCGAGAPRLTLPPGVGRYVLALGTVEPRKDLPGLVRAFELLAGERCDVGLVVAGADGWGAAALEAAVGASPFKERIVRLGYVSPARRDALLVGAAVLAYPSVYEGFGLPPLEAMSLGVPVVATRAGALPEVLGEGAALVDVGDPVGLAGAIAGLLDDEAASAALGAAGRIRARRFSWERCAEGLVSIYRDAIADRS